MASKSPSSIDDEIHFHQQGDGSVPVLVYFICGNPGLIEYYRETLTTLFDSLCKYAPKLHVHVYGHSLPGFSLDNRTDSKKNTPYTLNEIIKLTERRLLKVIEDTTAHSKVTPHTPARVVLIGHSVGSYMLLEILRHRHENVLYSMCDYDLIAGICLFPTIIHIAASPRGLWIAPLLKAPGLYLVIPTMIYLLLFLIPSIVLESLIQALLSMPPSGAKVTAAYLKSRSGIKQTLYMAKQEMSQLTDDVWTSQIWSPETALIENSPLRYKHTKLFFYWGANDYWVNNDLRDKLIAQRSATATHPNRAEMEVDTNNFPHAFCLRHSNPIARRIAKFLEQLL